LSFGMNVQFHPPQLQSARMAPLLRKVLNEVAAPQAAGELRVLRGVATEPMRLVFVCAGRELTSLTLPSDWLYTEIGEAQIREQLAHLIIPETGHASSAHRAPSHN
jgi:hypothetical protein